MMGRQTAWVWLVVLAMAACDAGEGLQVDRDEVSARDLQLNGALLNGFRLNGFRLNGFRLNGTRLDGDDGTGDYIELEAIGLPSDVTATDRYLVGSELRVELATGQVLAGAELEGAVLHFGVLDSTQTGGFNKRMVRIAEVLAPAPGSEVWRYDLRIKDSAGPWQPLCTDALGAGVPTILLGGAWDPTSGARLAGPEDAVTFACSDAALGKCAEWGYYPWALDDYHQACTRMVRADYCGDGVPHTVDGLTIHVLDDIGVEVTASGASYVVEAEWGPDGATCVNPDSTRLPDPTLTCTLPVCGEPFATGSLIETGTLLP